MQDVYIKLKFDFLRHPVLIYSCKLITMHVLSNHVEFIDPRDQEHICIHM